MNDIVNTTLPVVIGIFLGLIFFGGLWWTVRKMDSAKNPALLFFVSLLLRISIVMLGFYFIAQNHWERVLMCFVGFLLARTGVIQWSQSNSKTKNDLEKVPYAS